jgi:HPt (histidine-containing phosphotransfer) domain-containing protein
MRFQPHSIRRDSAAEPAASSSASRGATWATLPASAARPSIDDLLDGPSLDRLRALDPSGASGLVQRVLGTFVASLDKLLAQLQAARAAGDASAARHVAHTLKSSSASVGALVLAAQCAELEPLLRDADAGATMRALEPQLDAMSVEGLRIAAALRAALEGHV